MSMNWAQRKIYLYNVTFGLYMLDPWERYLFNSAKTAKEKSHTMVSHHRLPKPERFSARGLPFFIKYLTAERLHLVNSFHALVVVLMWFIFYNGYRNLNEICKRYVW